MAINLYELQEVYFTLNSTEGNALDFQAVEGKELRVDIQLISARNSVVRELLTFFIRVVDLYDTTPYFLLQNFTQVGFYSYGDPTYYEKISRYYSGPDLKFSLEFRYPNRQGYLLKPNITQTYFIDDQIRVFNVEEECLRSFFHFFVDPFTLEELTTFNCIQRHSIEQHTLEHGGKIGCQEGECSLNGSMNRRIFRFPRLNFLNFVFFEYPNTRTIISRLVLLSENFIRDRFELHFFGAGRQIIWRSKDYLDLNGGSLRPNDPLFGSSIDGLYFLVDSSETLIYCYLADFAIDETNFFTGLPERFGKTGVFQTITTRRRVSKVEYCCGDFIFISYYESNLVTFYQIHKDPNYETRLNEVSIEMFREFVYDQKITSLMINEEGNLLLFSDKNSIEHLQVLDLNRIAFRRKLPFFKYAHFMEFYMHSDDKRIA